MKKKNSFFQILFILALFFQPIHAKTDISKLPNNLEIFYSNKSENTLVEYAYNPETNDAIYVFENQKYVELYFIDRPSNSIIISEFDVSYDETNYNMKKNPISIKREVGLSKPVSILNDLSSSTITSSSYLGRIYYNINGETPGSRYITFYSSELVDKPIISYTLNSGPANLAQIATILVLGISFLTLPIATNGIINFCAGIGINIIGGFVSQSISENVMASRTVYSLYGTSNFGLAKTLGGYSYYVRYSRLNTTDFINTYTENFTAYDFRRQSPSLGNRIFPQYFVDSYWSINRWVYWIQIILMLLLKIVLIRKAAKIK